MDALEKQVILVAYRIRIAGSSFCSCVTSNDFQAYVLSGHFSFTTETKLK